MLSMLIEEAYVNNVILEEAKRKNVKGLNKVKNMSKRELKKRATERMRKRYMPIRGDNFRAKNPGPAMQPGVPVGQPQSYNLPVPSQPRALMVRPNPGFIMKDSGPTIHPGMPPVGSSKSRKQQAQSQLNLPVPAYAGLPATVQNSNNKNIMPWILGGLGVLGAGGLGAAMLNNDQNELIDTVQNIVN